MKKFLILIMCCVMTITIHAQVKVVSKNKLPKNIINFIESNYSDRKVMTYQIDYTNYNFNRINEYEIIYENGTKIEFLKNGQLQSIECGRLDFVKWNIFPEPISYFIKKKFPERLVLDYSIEYRCKKPYKYEVKLNTGLELVFNKKYQLISIE